jgi:hypothetical protein
VHNFRCGKRLIVLRARSLVQLRWTRDDAGGVLCWTRDGGRSGVVPEQFSLSIIVFVFGHLLPMNEQNDFIEAGFDRW